MSDIESSKNAIAHATYWWNTVVETSHLSERVAPKIGPMMRDDAIYSTTQLYNQSTLQPIETVSAIRLNLRRSNCDDCINRPRQMRYPDRVRPPQRGEDERRKGQKKSPQLSDT